MSDLAVLIVGGGGCGLIAGLAAQFGRLCTFGAIEDALYGGDLRRARAYALALAIALALTQGLVAAGLLDISQAVVAKPRLELASLVIGALLFGIGMSLVGTCGFGMLVRLGTGDLRALVSTLVLGLTAFAATGGITAPLRLALDRWGSLDLGAFGGTLSGQASGRLGAAAGPTLAIALAAALAAGALLSARTRRKVRMLLAGAALGIAIAGGFVVTGVLADPFGAARLESLTFVAPVGRLLLAVMGQTLASAAFAIATVVGAVLGSFAVSAARDELRWEAFDDQREMRRHLLGAALMGTGGVMAGGCTIGQGLSAASLLAVSAPIAIVFMVLGARLGLFLLIAKPVLIPGWLTRRRRALRSPQ